MTWHLAAGPGTAAGLSAPVYSVHPKLAEDFRKAMNFSADQSFYELCYTCLTTLLAQNKYLTGRKVRGKLFLFN